MRTFGIDLLSVFSMPPVEFITLAADLGRPSISLALAPFASNPEQHPAWSLRSDTGLRSNVRAALADRGMALALGEGFLLLPDLDVRGAYERDLEIMAGLGAGRICVVSLDPDPVRTLDGYAQTAELAAAVGMSTVVEFAPCFSSTPNLAAALTAKKHVGRADFRILIDTMHFARSGGTAADLAALPPDTVGYAQICDVPSKPIISDYMQEAMLERRAPGDGDLPLGDLINALPPDTTFSLEVPLASEAEAGAGSYERMRRVVSATKNLMRSCP